MYEEAMHLPLLIRWPEHIPAGTRVDALVQNIDLAPTFLEMAGAPVPDRMQGRSLLSVLDGASPPNWRDAVYCHYFDHMRHRVARHAGVRTARYKLIHFYTDDTWELYDLEADPHELQDVVEQPGYQGVVIEMKTIYERLKQKYAVPEDVFHPPFALVGKG